MYYFKNEMTKDELSIMRDISAYKPEYKLIREFSGECYILTCKELVNGEYVSRSDIYPPESLFEYEQCFGAHSDYYSNNKFEFLKCKPLQIIKFNTWYLVKTEQSGWSRGELMDNGNILLDAYADSLEEIIGAL